MDERAKQVEEFEATKTGVKGIVDSGATKIPKLFIHPPEILEKGLNKPSTCVTGIRIPVIDLKGYDDNVVDRREIVDAIRSAVETLGFFQIINHGIPKEDMEGLLQGVRRFHEQATEEKMRWYGLDPKKGVMYYSNGSLRMSSAPAEWRDTLTCIFQDGQLKPEKLPQACRREIIEYMKGLERLKKLLAELLSEALGLGSDLLENLNYMKSDMLVGHYYPACPEPDLTLGLSKHSDPYVLTLLLKDNTGGLQVHHQDHWIDVPHLEGALIANVGDLMQIISNDRFKSVEHRVLAREAGGGPRISAACFFYPTDDTKVGPIKELLTENNPSIYKQLHYMEYISYWASTRLGGHSSLPHFKLENYTKSASN